MIAIGLNLILGVLLFCALILGLRLERKLRGLRDSHADFAKAVSELDQAAGRTEHSLTALRAGTETAKNEVASRIDQARIACQRLEKLVADADKAADRLAAQPLALMNVAPPPPRAAQAPQPPLPAPSAIARPEPDLRRPAEPLRSRARMVDDDLFDLGPPPAVRERPAREPQIREPQIREPQPAQAFVAAAPAAATRAPKADNDPLVGAPRNDRAARDARVLQAELQDAYQEPLSGPFARDPFEHGRFAHERRAMLAAVMGGRR